MARTTKTTTRTRTARQAHAENLAKIETALVKLASWTKDQRDANRDHPRTIDWAHVGDAANIATTLTHLVAPDGEEWIPDVVGGLSTFLEKMDAPSGAEHWTEKDT